MEESEPSRGVGTSDRESESRESEGSEREGSKRSELQRRRSHGKDSHHLSLSGFSSASSAADISRGPQKTTKASD